jgi:inactivated superfamily I helicase
MTDYKATPEQWADAGAFASGTRACILELRARVEALEEAENDRRFEAAKVLIDKPAPALAGSLVERVRKALSYPPGPYARAAIREVATWLRENYPRREGYGGTAWANLIEEEADRG